MNNLPTIVTAIYNIRQMEGSSHEQKTMQLNKYIELASQFILTLPYPLIIFIDDSLTPDAQELEKTIIEKRQPFPGKTHIYKEPFSNTYFYKDINKLIELEDTDNHNHLLYSVPYHPETNSIEEFFSQLKHYIKKESPNTYEDIDTTIKDILANKIKKEHLINYLKHSYKIYKS